MCFEFYSQIMCVCIYIYIYPGLYITDDFSPVVEVLLPSSASVAYERVSVSCVKLYKIHFIF